MSAPQLSRRFLRMQGSLVAMTLAFLAAGCASDKPKPAALEAVAAVSGPVARIAWTVKTDKIGFPLQAAIFGQQLVVATEDGAIVTVDAEAGREISRMSVGSRLSAGVGFDGRFLAVVSRDNELIVAEGRNVKWRQRLPARVLTAPLVAGERVFAMGVDRVVHAFDALDGRKLWTFQRPGDPLSLAQPGVLTAYRDTLLVGQGQRLVGVDPLRGTVRWEIPLGTVRGTNEVERLADLVGPAARVGDVVCTRAFQAAVGCADAASSTLLWTRNVSGAQAVGADNDLVVAADAADRLSAWRRATGELVWTTEKLTYRGLGGVQVWRDRVVVGDDAANLHVLDKTEGRTVQRLQTEGALVAHPRVVGQTLVLVTRSGAIHGLRTN